jgi:hypothetical protein
MTIILWYCFIVVYISTSLGLATLNGAGVIFGSGMFGFGILMHLIWLGLGELRKIRQTLEESRSNSNAQLELQVGIADATQTTAQLLEALQNDPVPPAPVAMHQNGVKS